MSVDFYTTPTEGRIFIVIERVNQDGTVKLLVRHMGNDGSDIITPLNLNTMTDTANSNIVILIPRHKDEMLVPEPLIVEAK